MFLTWSLCNSKVAVKIPEKLKKYSVWNLHINFSSVKYVEDEEAIVKSVTVA